MSELADELAWQAQANCLGEDPDLFFPEPYAAVRAMAKVKVICDGCSVKAECLRFALSHHERHGIWAATTPKDRSRMLRRNTAAHGTARRYNAGCDCGPCVEAHRAVRIRAQRAYRERNR